MRKPVFGQENGLSFLLQLGCEELTVSCEMHWPCSLPLWNSHTGRVLFLPVFPLSVRKLPPGAGVYPSKRCRMGDIVHL